jgi:CitMHS family citrate-Mg2+:H+ or citrate-Ca2+:H+ symporter
VFVAWMFGRRERARLAAVDGVATEDAEDILETAALGSVDASLLRPKLLWLNVTLTVALLVALVAGLLPLPVLFLTAYAIALLVNFPTMEQQKSRLEAHAPNALAVASVICAAGVLTGIMSGTKMVDAMGNSVIAWLPASLAPHMAVVTGVLSLPFTFFLSNDAFYFGVLPILNQAGALHGVTAAEMGRASIVGQPVHLLSPLVPSTYLLVGLVGIELGDHQRFTLKWSAITCMVLLVIGLATAVIPIR